MKFTETLLYISALVDSLDADAIKKLVSEFTFYTRTDSSRKPDSNKKTSFGKTSVSNFSRIPENKKIQKSFSNIKISISECHVKKEKSSKNKEISTQKEKTKFKLTKLDNVTIINNSSVYNDKFKLYGDFIENTQSNVPMKEPFELKTNKSDHKSVSSSVESRDLSMPENIYCTKNGSAKTDKHLDKIDDFNKKEDVNVYNFGGRNIILHKSEIRGANDIISKRANLNVIGKFNAVENNVIENKNATRKRNELACINEVGNRNKLLSQQMYRSNKIDTTFITVNHKKCPEVLSVNYCSTIMDKGFKKYPGTELKNVEWKNAEFKNAELKNVESKDVESKHMKSKYFESKNVELKNVGFKNVELKNLESEYMESKYMESKYMESKYMESKYMESKYMESKYFESKNAELKNVGLKNVELKNEKNKLMEKKHEENVVGFEVEHFAKKGRIRENEQRYRFYSGPTEGSNYGNFVYGGHHQYSQANEGLTNPAVKPKAEFQNFYEDDFDSREKGRKTCNNSTRIAHNMSEKNRRADLRTAMECLKNTLPMYQCGSLKATTSDILHHSRNHIESLKEGMKVKWIYRDQLFVNMMKCLEKIILKIMEIAENKKKFLFSQHNRTIEVKPEDVFWRKCNDLVESLNQIKPTSLNNIEIAKILFSRLNFTDIEDKRNKYLESLAFSSSQTFRYTYSVLSKVYGFVLPKHITQKKIETTELTYGCVMDSLSSCSIFMKPLLSLSSSDIKNFHDFKLISVSSLRYMLDSFTSLLNESKRISMHCTDHDHAQEFVETDRDSDYSSNSSHQVFSINSSFSEHEACSLNSENNLVKIRSISTSLNDFSLKPISFKVSCNDSKSDNETLEAPSARNTFANSNAVCGSTAANDSCINNAIASNNHADANFMQKRNTKPIDDVKKKMPKLTFSVNSAATKNPL